MNESKKWQKIRNQRDEMLKKYVDPAFIKIVYGDISQNDMAALKRIRRRLLDLPAEIQAKIDSGDLESVLKYRFNEREILGIPDPTVQSKVADNSGEQ